MEGGSIMDRNEMMKSLMDKKRQVTMEYYKWLSTPREYFPGDSLYMREVHIIMEIGLEGIDNVSELGEKLKITQGAVSQQLGKLEKKGYLERIQDQRDKRQYSVRLTEKGRNLYECHRRYDEESYQLLFHYFDEFTQEELEIIRRFDVQFGQAVERMQAEP